MFTRYRLACRRVKLKRWTVTTKRSTPHNNRNAHKQNLQEIMSPAILQATPSSSPTWGRRSQRWTRQTPWRNSSPRARCSIRSMRATRSRGGQRFRYLSEWVCERTRHKQARAQVLYFLDSLRGKLAHHLHGAGMNVASRLHRPTKDAALHPFSRDPCPPSERSGTAAASYSSSQADSASLDPDSSHDASDPSSSSSDTSSSSRLRLFDGAWRGLDGGTASSFPQRARPSTLQSEASIIPHLRRG
jgi:hypothetical protein